MLNKDCYENKKNKISHFADDVNRPDDDSMQ
jgi:hypothetical protein